MKFTVNFMLFIFITFLSVPTIVTMIEKESDVSAFYSFAEEEIQKEVKEIKADIKITSNIEFSRFSNSLNSKIISDSKSKHDSISEDIFSPPPELI